MYAFDVATIRDLEARAMAEVGDDTLMQRAAAGLAAAARRMLAARRGSVYGAQVVIFVGSGNNGGDALFAGARLARRGARVVAVPCLGAPHPSGLTALLEAGGRTSTLAELTLDDIGARPRPHIDLFLDGILGIGGRAGLTGVPASAAAAMNRWSIPVLAVDLPSGVEADSGAVPGVAVRASRTVTFGTYKPCHLVEPARRLCGEVELVDIGLPEGPEPLLDAMTEDRLYWPGPPSSGDKYARGVVGVDTGSDQYPGAGLLSTLGTVYGGAGMVRFVGAERPAKLIESHLPNVVFSPGRVQAHLFGSGWGERADGTKVLAAALDSDLPAVVDADGLKYLPPRVPASWLLTPHAGELAALLHHERSWVTDDPVRAVREGSEATGATVLLKGATQFVASSGRPVLVALPGPAWTAQAGSGDVLGGVCAALLAAGINARRAGQLAASVQALTAARTPGAVPPQDLAREIGRVIGTIAVPDA